MGDGLALAGSWLSSFLLESPEFDRSDAEPEGDEVDGCAEFVSAAAAAADPVDVPDVPADVPPPESDAPELDDEPSELVDEPGSATAIPGLLAIAAPTPNATANPPILPTNRPEPDLCGVLVMAEPFRELSSDGMSVGLDVHTLSAIPHAADLAD